MDSAPLARSDSEEEASSGSGVSDAGSPAAIGVASVKTTEDVASGVASTAVLGSAILQKSLQARLANLLA